MYRYLIVAIFLLIPVLAMGQDYEMADRVYSGNIKTVKLHRPEWNLSYPVIKLNSDEKLVLHFDLLGNNIETYYYSFIHCDRDWNVSDIFSPDYIKGFEENQVRDYSISFNTTVNYIHYSLTFPNEDISFKLSGNYIVKVYPAGYPDEPVLTRRFMISEEAVSITAEPQRPKLPSAYNSGQQIDFTVEYPGGTITDPYRTVFASILQNGRWDKQKNNLKPDFIGNKQLRYNDIDGKYTFAGGSEFRYFDIKSLRYQTEYVRAVEHENGRYHVYLMHSDNRSDDRYFYHQDFNGKYFTAIQEGRDHELEADYVFVYFTLPSAFPVKNGDVYVNGALSGWELNEQNRMSYNYELNRYELTMLLKQGWYNYIYTAADKRGNILSDQSFESDHFETENDYLILVYLAEPMDRYDRLIGAKITNTLNRNN
ncbi:MAG: DUF5103 domain-containing protein [Marinilabiliaceae bacterium]|jgi:hypothetical protein|nr:DUF5103 domain-containing protein [Marinilabiliaceae bacterium]